MASLNAIEAAYDQLEQCSFDALSAEELVAVLTRREALAWRAPVIDHRILARLAAEGNPGVLGASSLAVALAERLRISTAEAQRRLADATDLGPRATLTGDPLEPVLPELAAAQAAGSIGPEHVAIARKAYAKIPGAVTAPDRARAERDLALLAGEFGPQAFQKLADHLVAVLDPDGDFTDRERRARRGLRMGRQGVDGLSALNGKITPELRATLEPLLAKLSAPGMCNPADEHPCVSGTPTEEQIHGDARTPDQRRHDALLAAGRAVLASGDLGQLNGLPVTVIVTTTLAEMHAAAHATTTRELDAAAHATTLAEADAAAQAATAADGAAHAVSAPSTEQEPPPAEPRITGKALTAGGTLLPMTDLLRMASHAYHYLTVFDGRGRALWLGRTKRIASADQRVVLHARDHGCTRPGCTVPGYLTQAHHLEHDWADDGHTNVDTLGLACPADNRMASQQDWITRLGESGRVEWIPPPELERGQPRTNPYHFIEDLIDYHNQRTGDVGCYPVDGHPPPVNEREQTRDGPVATSDDWPWFDDALPGDADHPFPRDSLAGDTEDPFPGDLNDPLPDDPLPGDPLPGDPDYDHVLADLHRVDDAAVTLGHVDIWEATTDDRRVTAQ